MMIQSIPSPHLINKYLCNSFSLDLADFHFLYVPIAFSKIAVEWAQVPMKEEPEKSRDEKPKRKLWIKET
jgi:hypothetical protein